MKGKIHMSNINLTPIIEAVIALISVIFTVYILPKRRAYRQEKLSAEQRKKRAEVVGVAVKAAEKLYGSKMGVEKKQYVLDYLENKGIQFDIEEVENLIESFVYELSGTATDEALNKYDICEEDEEPEAPDGDAEEEEILTE